MYAFREEEHLNSRKITVCRQEDQGYKRLTADDFGQDLLDYCTGLIKDGTLDEYFGRVLDFDTEPFAYTEQVVFSRGFVSLGKWFRDSIRRDKVVLRISNTGIRAFSTVSGR